MRKRFSNISRYDQNRSKRKKGVSKKKIIEHDVDIDDNIYVKRFFFLGKIYISLKNSGFRIPFIVVMLIFLLYIFVFFLIGSRFFANWYFPKISKDVSIEEIVNDSKYSNLKKGMLIISYKKLNLDGFIAKLSQKDILKRYLSVDYILNNGLSESVQKEIEDFIKEKCEEYIGNYFDVDLKTIMLDFSQFQFNVNNSSEELDKSGEIKEKVKKSISNFYSGLRESLRSFLEENYINELIKLSNPSYQNAIFSFTFGMIFIIGGIFIFNIFIYKSLTEMHIKNMRIELPNWIQILTNSLQAGLSLEQSLEFSMDKVMRDPLKSAVREITTRYRTFKDLTNALKPLERWYEKVPETKLLASSLKIYQRKGGNIVPILYSLNKVIRKRDTFVQKVDSITSESTGQLKIVFILFFGIILFSERIFNASQGFFSPFYSFCNKGGGLSGSIGLFLLHFFFFLLSYLLLVGGNIIIRREIKF